MKLHNIYLQNVYGHAETEIDVSDVDAAVIAGPNGAGKSSLIAYGPLFALYGRKAVQGDTYADLVRHGAEQATASVTFELGGQLYRVTRTYSMRTKSGSSSLEFVRRNGNDWVPEATGSISEVEQAIADTIGVDYETMTTGSIQCQGQSGRFTTARSSERINLLSQLLGVEHLQDAFTEAGRMRRSCEDRLEDMADEIEKRQQLDQKVDAKADEVQQAQQKLEELPQPQGTDDIDDDLEYANGVLDRLNQEVADYEELRDQLEQERKAKGKVESKLADVQKALASAQTKAQSLEEKADIDQVHGYNTVGEAQKAGESLRDTYDQAKDDAKQLREARKATRSAQSELDRLSDRFSSLWGDAVDTLNELERGLAEVDLTYPVDRDEVERNIEAIEGALEEVQETWETFQQREQKLAEWADDLERRTDRHQDRLDSLRDTAQTVDERNQEVPEEKCRDCGLLQAAWDAADQLEEAQSVDFSDEVEELEDAQDQLAQERADAGLESRSDYQQRRDQLRDRRRTLVDCAETVDYLGDLLDELRDKRSRYQQVDDERAEAQATVVGIQDKYDLEEGDRPTDGMERELERAREAFTELQKRDNAADQLAEVQSQIDRLGQKVDDHQHELEGYDEVITKLEDDLEGYQWARRARELTLSEIQRLRDARDDRQDQDQQRRQAIADQKEQVAKLESTLSTLEERLDQMSDLDQKVDDLRAQKQRLGYARQFFKAAPNLVIGSAIPRLEQQANAILDDIFPGVSLRVERQKQNRSGGKTDKLHLRILRNGAEQAYECFSGGEQFLLNVAVRLGLAKAASARQSGRPIDLLIVDEGFGALDPDNTTQVKDSLLKLAKKFSQIFVISHVPEVRDAFGTVITVEETGDGTDVTIQ